MKKSIVISSGLLTVCVDSLRLVKNVNGMGRDLVFLEVKDVAISNFCTETEKLVYNSMISDEYSNYYTLELKKGNAAY